MVIVAVMVSDAADPVAGRPEASLVTALDTLAGEVLADLCEPVALSRARTLLAACERLKALALHAVADVHARGLHATEDAPTAAAWVAAQPVSGVARDDVTLARRLTATPLVSAELAAGRLSCAAAGQVAAAVAKARPFLDRPGGFIDGQPAEPALHGVVVDGVAMLLAEATGGALPGEPDQSVLRGALETIVARGTSQRDRLEAGLVFFARRCPAGLLRSGLGLLLDALLPAQHEARARRAERQAGLDLHRRAGGSGWWLSGELDDETGELLHTVLGAARATDPDNPGDTEAWRVTCTEGDYRGADLADLEPADWPAALPRPRNDRQAQHDALRLALRCLLDSAALGSREKAHPHVAVSVSLDFVQGLPGALPGRALSGARWSREQTRRLLCQGTFTRLVLDAAGRVIGASHTGRTATALERMIAHVQWGGHCAAAGCIRGPDTGHPIVPHHGALFSHTGTTALHDTIPLCERDHHYLHADRCTLRLKDGRRIGPDGWVQRA